MSVTDVHSVHTVESKWTFKEMSYEKYIQVFKGFILYHSRVSCNLNQPLDVDDVIMLITSLRLIVTFLSSSDDYHFGIVALGVNMITRAGRYHVESSHPSVLVSKEGSKDKEVASDLKVHNGNCLFVE